MFSIFKNQILLIVICAAPLNACLKHPRTAKLSLASIKLQERGFDVNGNYQFTLTPVVKNTGLIHTDAKLAAECSVPNSEQSTLKTESFFLSLGVGESASGREMLFSSGSANPGAKIHYDCHLVAADNSTKSLLSGGNVASEFEVTGSSSSE